MATSSLTPDEEPRGRKAAGGGVVLAPPMLLDSENVSQNVLPLEFFIACCLKLLERPVDKSTIMSSSATSSMEYCCDMLGDEGAVVVTVPCVDSMVTDEGMMCSRAMSLSRTCFTTSASRRNSDSAGAPSSMRAARIRANVFVFGYMNVQRRRHLQQNQINLPIDSRVA